MSGELREPEWDQLSIDTPELVSIEMPVAGLGSRFVALLVDYLIWLAALVLFVSIFAMVHPSLEAFDRLGRKWITALAILVVFLVYWGYFTLFEAFWSGRTPGKWVAKIRVIQISGRGIGLFESMTRNLLRIVDQFPGIYAVGVVSIFLSREHQRLGDMAAGTLVVHERERLTASMSESSTRTFTAGIFEAARTEDRRVAAFELSSEKIQRLGPADLEVLEGFFARRLDLSLMARTMLAQRILNGVLAKSGLEMPPEVGTETFLEEVARRLRDFAMLG